MKTDLCLPGRTSALAGVLGSFLILFGGGDVALGSRPVALSPPEFVAQAPHAVSDGLGGAFSVWALQEASQQTIRAQHLNSEGFPVWGTHGAVVAPAQSNQILGAPAGDGGMLVAWVESLTGNVRLQRMTPAGAPVWPQPGVPVYWGSVYDISLKQLVSDGQGGAFIVHVVEDDLDEPPSDQTFLSHVTPAGAVDWSHSLDRGCTDTYWGVDAVSDGNGGIVLAQIRWCGEQQEVWGFRVNAQGAYLWGDGVLICSAPHLRSVPRISASANSLDFHVGWIDGRAGGGTGRLYLQRLNPSGQRQWQVNGVPVSPAGQMISFWSSWELMSSGPEAFAVWPRTLSQSAFWNYEMRVQRVGGSGEPLWNPSEGGRVIGSSDSGQASSAMLISDGAWGVIIGWQHSLFTDSSYMAGDIYLNRLDGAGNSLWGRTVGAANNLNWNEKPAGLVLSAPGEALVVYQAENSIYARTMPDPQTHLGTTQKLRIVAAPGAYWQALSYDYETAQAATYAARAGVGDIFHNPRPDGWTGLFLYEYAEGRFTEAVYDGQAWVE